MSVSQNRRIYTVRCLSSSHVDLQTLSFWSFIYNYMTRGQKLICHECKQWHIKLL